MTKIGFIDYYLDEWHADNYPAWIREASGGEMEVAWAYGHVNYGEEDALWDAVSVPAGGWRVQ